MSVKVQRAPRQARLTTELRTASYNNLRCLPLRRVPRLHFMLVAPQRIEAIGALVRRLPALLGLITVLHGCDAGPAEPMPATAQPATYDPDWAATLDPSRQHKGGGRTEKRKVHALTPASVQRAADDPLVGSWTLGQALEGLPPGSELSAVIQTTLGDLRCGLWPDKAPITVANFVGLARGLRPWKTASGAWDKRPAYDGTSFYRVLPGFVIQGGSPNGQRDGGPGYVIPDEIWEDANHDRAGLLCMANLGKNKGGMQFFVTDGPALHLDGGYTIFGECGPIELVHRLATVEADRGRPNQELTIQSVRIERAGALPASPPEPCARSTAVPSLPTAARPLPR
jgi:peptidyl-prolyl cis-trans isomerase A (cyclophilin A)